jgi:hypothetical protein
MDVDELGLSEDEALPEGSVASGSGGVKRKAPEGQCAGVAGKRAKPKSKSGLKFCPPCNTTHPVSDFPAGKAQCGKAFNALRNLRAAAIAQKQEDWWAEAPLSKATGLC